MILVHPDLEKQIYIENSSITEWIIESPDLFSKYLEELYNQVNGGDGVFVLSNANKEISLSKSIDIIFNPLAIDLNDKKIINKVYNDLQIIANDERMYLRTREVIGILQQYFFELEQHHNTSLVIEDDIDLSTLFKTLGIKVEKGSLDYFEQLIKYIKIQTEILNKKLIVLVNIRSFLSIEKLEQLFQYVKYNEIHLLLIESIQRDFTNLTNKFIIDIDKCEI